MPEASFSGWEKEESDPLLLLEKLEQLSILEEGDEDEVFTAEEEQSQSSQNSSQKKKQKQYTQRPAHPTNFGSWTVENLRLELASRGLKKSGKKAELLQRLTENIREGSG